MPNPFTVTSGTNPDVPVATFDAKGNLAIAGQLSVGAQADPSGASVDNQPPFVTSADTVPAYPLTINGVSTIQLALPGPLVSPAPGQAYRFECWGTVQTTVDTQTYTAAVILGGLNGTVINSLLVTPDSSGVVSGAAIRFTGSVVFRSATLASVGWQLDSDFFPVTVTQGAATIPAAPGQQLVLAITPSATAMSIAIAGGYWQRVA